MSDDNETPSTSTKTEGPVVKTKRVPSFEELGLNSWLAQQCRAMGLKHPTPVQSACIAPALDGEGRDVIGCAQTGTGKTLAFALPILQRLAADPYGIFSLVLTPTRELAFQIADQFKALGKPIGVQVAVIVGGRDMLAQSLDLQKRPHILIATPGRLYDHLASQADETTTGDGLNFRGLRFLVLDEADRLLDGQYESHLQAILKRLPAKRQTLLFSATITDALTRLKEMSIRSPFFWEDIPQVTTVAALEQRYVLCPADVKDAYVVHVVKRYISQDTQSRRRVMIFCQTCREASALWLAFRDLGFPQVYPLHSLVPQRERLAGLGKFRAGIAQTLVCTDVAARGLDIPMVDLVVNHNVPAVPKNYVHRVGRAARAGHVGQAITFVTQYDVSLLQAIESFIGTEIKELKISAARVAENVTEVLVARREAEVKLDEDQFGEKREINKKKEMILNGESGCNVLAKLK